MKDFIRWIEDTVAFTLSRKYRRQIDEEEVISIVNTFFENSLGNRNSLDIETMDLLCDNAIRWSYEQLKDDIVYLSEELPKYAKTEITKECMAEISIDQYETSNVSINTNKTGKRWPLDRDGVPIKYDDKTLVLDAKEYDKIVILK